MAAKNRGIWHITEMFCFFDNVFNPKSFVIYPKIVLQLEYMVWAAIYIIIPGYYRIYGSKCPFSL